MTHADLIKILRDHEWTPFGALIREAADALAEREWQTIETAPKDGTPVLLWVPEFNAPIQGEWCSSDDGFVDASHWVDVWNNDAIETKDGPVNPTHWQPRPPAPKPEADR